MLSDLWRPGLAEKHPRPRLGHVFLGSPLLAPPHTAARGSPAARQRYTRRAAVWVPRAGLYKCASLLVLVISVKMAMISFCSHSGPLVPPHLHRFAGPADCLAVSLQHPLAVSHTRITQNGAGKTLVTTTHTTKLCPQTGTSTLMYLNALVPAFEHYFGIINIETQIKKIKIYN